MGAQGAPTHRRVPMRSRTFAFMLLAAACAALPSMPGAARSADDAAYRVPPPVIADLLTAPRLPRGAPNASPNGAWLAVSDLRSLIPIGVLAEPVQKVAGLEVLPGMWANRIGLKNAAAGLTFYRVADGTRVRAKLPADVQLGTVKWSNDGEGMFVSLVVDGSSPTIEASRIPDGPAVRKGAGRATPQRTARDVLRSPEDQARFAAVATTQLAWVPVDEGAMVKLGEPVALADCDLSPDDNWIVQSRYVLPAPLGFPYYLFPRKVELLKASNRAIVPLGDVPLN